MNSTIVPSAVASRPSTANSTLLPSIIAASIPGNRPNRRPAMKYTTTSVSVAHTADGNRAPSSE